MLESSVVHIQHLSRRDYIVSAKIELSRSCGTVKNHCLGRKN
jgi:hypothetical protein